MPRGVRYFPNRAGVAKLLTSNEMEALLLRFARRGAQWLTKNTPRESTELSRNYFIESFPTGGGPRGDRAHAQIKNSLHYILAVEFGYRHAGTGEHIEGHHMMRRSIDHMGG